MASIFDKAQTLAGANTINPVLQGYDESKGVEGRVASITGKDSPLMQLASTRAKQSANKLGMRNSSLAVGAGQRAVLDAATPIASADASLFQQQTLANQAARNTAETANKTNALTSGMQGIGMDQSQGQFDANLGEQRRQFDTTTGLNTRQLSLQEKAQADELAMKTREVDNQVAQFAQTLGLSQQDMALKRDSLTQQQQQFLAGLEQQKAELAQQASQFGSNLALQTRAQGAQESQAEKQQALQVAQLDAQKEQFAQQLGMTAQELDLKRETLTTQQQQFLANLDQQKAELAQQGSQFGQNLSLQTAQLDAQKEQFAQQLGMTAQELDLKRDTLDEQSQQFLANLDQQKAQLAQNLTMFDKEIAQKAEQFGLTQQQQMALANLDVASKKELAGIEAAFKNEIQSSANISNAWGSMLAEVGKINNNPDLEEAAKTTLVNNTIGAFKQYAEFWNKTTGMDVSALLNFGAGAAGGAAGGSSGGATGVGRPGMNYGNYADWQGIPA